MIFHVHHTSFQQRATNLTRYCHRRGPRPAQTRAAVAGAARSAGKPCVVRPDRLHEWGQVPCALQQRPHPMYGGAQAHERGGPGGGAVAQQHDGGSLLWGQGHRGPAGACHRPILRGPFQPVQPQFTVAMVHHHTRSFEDLVGL